MKKKKVLIACIIYLFLVVTFFSCGGEIEQEEKETPGEFYSSHKLIEDIQIVKVRDCEYVLWHNGYGSNMEHYAGCNNIEHCK